MARRAMLRQAQHDIMIVGTPNMARCAMLRQAQHDIMIVDVAPNVDVASNPDVTLSLSKGEPR
jgi:hypothetical protein